MHGKGYVPDTRPHGGTVGKSDDNNNNNRKVY